MSDPRLEALVREIVSRAVARLAAEPAPAPAAAPAPAVEPLKARVDAWLGRVPGPAAPGAGRAWTTGDRPSYLRATPARLGVGRAGCRVRTETWLAFLRDHAAARDAVSSRVDPALVERLGLVPLRSAARDRREFLLRPDLGRRLDADSAALVKARGLRGARLQLVVVDGLSASALDANLAALLGACLPALGAEAGPPAPGFFVQDGRVAVGDEVARLLDSELLVTVAGERPGLKTAESLGVYVTYFRGRTITEAERSMISNIHAHGLPAEEAGRQLAKLCQKALATRHTGVEVKG